eukprot:TRINITY_DN46947_c0_g1_i1.p1 TRINITY_DN46947_c0_g1~~TRINITY_DN46947_c0_g1_i1.p1  ORF type:complete len:535 (+),score=141.59 TRINITY_DN46947_c0_g1_i1:64-1605(+)
MHRDPAVVALSNVHPLVPGGPLRSPSPPTRQMRRRLGDSTSPPFVVSPSFARSQQQRPPDGPTEYVHISLDNVSDLTGSPPLPSGPGLLVVPSPRMNGRVTSPAAGFATPRESKRWQRRSSPSRTVAHGHLRYRDVERDETDPLDQLSVSELQAESTLDSFPTAAGYRNGGPTPSTVTAKQPPSLFTPTAAPFLSGASFDAARLADRAAVVARRSAPRANLPPPRAAGIARRPVALMSPPAAAVQQPPGAGPRHPAAGQLAPPQWERRSRSPSQSGGPKTAPPRVASGSAGRLLSSDTRVAMPPTPPTSPAPKDPDPEPTAPPPATLAGPARAQPPQRKPAPGGGGGWEERGPLWDVLKEVQRLAAGGTHLPPQLLERLLMAVPAAAPEPRGHSTPEAAPPSAQRTHFGPISPAESPRGRSASTGGHTAAPPPPPHAFSPGAASPTPSPVRLSAGQQGRRPSGGCGDSHTGDTGRRKVPELVLASVDRLDVEAQRLLLQHIQRNLELEQRMRS